MTAATSTTLDLPRSGRPRRERPATDYSVVLQTVLANHLTDRRYGYYAAKIGLTFAAIGGLFVAFAFIGESWVQIAIAAALGIAFTQILFISHEAAHRQIFKSNAANEYAALIMGTLFGGISLAWWHNKHNKHHAAPNQRDRDPDISPTIVHFYPADPAPQHRLWRWMHQRQGWWFFPLLVVEALNLHAQSIQTLVSVPNVKRRKTELCMMAVRLGLYPAMVFVFLPAGIAAAFLGTQLAVTGIYLGVVFSASHIGMPVVDSNARIDFFRRQVLTSRNITGGRFMSWFMGSLNLQIEHHLFPNAPGPSLRKIQVLVRDFCATHSVGYSEMSLGRAWGTVAGYLNRVGLGADASFRCPVVSELRPS